MARFLVRRLLLSIITLFILLVVVFALTRVFPQDVAKQLAGPFAPQQRVDDLNEKLGLLDPVSTQFGRLVGDVVTLDFGESYSQPGVKVVDLIRPALWNSAKLVMLALLITLPLSILGGIMAARRKDTRLDRAIVSLGLASASIPDFVSGVILQLLIGVKLGWLPATSSSVPADAGFFTSLRFILLPALAIVLVYFGYIARITRAGAIGVFDSDYARTAYMKGLSPWEVIKKHVLRNALQPTVAVTGTQMGYLFGGLVGLERVFNYPGLGNLILRAALAPDLPLLQTGVLTVAVIFMLATLSSDLLIAWMNPRARLAGGEN
ncbi:MAG: ABC transporter permease [Acidimicrobiales bacterium]|nr:ABC transporter permease [Acidimicrobiales bacterium]